MKKTLLDCIVFEPDPEKERREKLKELYAEKKRLKAEIRRRTAKDTAYGIITDISSKAGKLDYVLHSKRGRHSVKVLKKQHKQVERFVKKYLPKLERVRLDNDDMLRIDNFEAQISIMRMRYDALKSYNDKLCQL